MERKSKFTLEIKLAAVKRILKNHENLKPIAKELGCEPQVLRLWRNLYALHGKKGLVVIRKQYSGEFKLKAVEYVRKGNNTVIGACSKFIIPDLKTLRGWLHKYDTIGPLGLINNKELSYMVRKIKHPKAKHPSLYTEEEIQKLIDENEQLRMENDFLKKLDALTQDHPDYLGNVEQPE